MVSDSATPASFPAYFSPAPAHNFAHIDKTQRNPRGGHAEEHSAQWQLRRYSISTIATPLFRTCPTAVGLEGEMLRITTAPQRLRE